MALKVELKPDERFILGGCLITNGPQRIRLLIEGDAPLLREKGIIKEKQQIHRQNAFISPFS
jgi:flagellar protein FlbT